MHYFHIFLISIDIDDTFSDDKLGRLGISDESDASHGHEEQAAFFRGVRQPSFESLQGHFGAGLHAHQSLAIGYKTPAKCALVQANTKKNLLNDWSKSALKKWLCNK